MAKLTIKYASDVLDRYSGVSRASIGHNRWVEIEGDVVYFGLHQTRLVEWNTAQSTVRVRHGRWASRTTRAAMADFLRLFARPSNAADGGRLAMLEGSWRPVGREFDDFTAFVL